VSCNDVPHTWKIVLMFFFGHAAATTTDSHFWFRVDLSAHAFSHVHTHMSAVFVALEHLSLRIVLTDELRSEYSGPGLHEESSIEGRLLKRGVIIRMLGQERDKYEPSSHPPMSSVSRTRSPSCSPTRPQLIRPPEIHRRRGE